MSSSQPDPLKNTSESSGCETKDDTDSNVDEGTNTHNKKVFSNKNTEKNFPEVRHLFKVTSNGYVGCCSICHRDVKLSGRSDANMRSHLSNVHKMPDILLPSQTQRKEGIKIDKICIGREEKGKIDNQIIDFVIKDSRTFNDFHKPGMRKLLHLLKPGYKPCSKEN